jgi:nucleotide-binding universal stress UspA family protein
MITRILCSTDFSECARAALPVACSLARDYGARLIVLHVRPTTEAVVGEFGVVPSEPPEPEARVKARMQQSMPPDFRGTVEFQVRDGDAAEEIVNAAQKGDCNFIVLGTHGRTGLRRLLLGSVAEAVLRRAACPVLTIKAAPGNPRAAAIEETTEREPERDPNQLVTVCSMANPAEADVIRNALEAEQIPSFLEGAQQAGIVGVLGVPIRVQVRVGDFNRASKLIKMREARRR